MAETADVKSYDRKILKILRAPVYVTCPRKYNNPTGKYTQVAEIVKTGSLCFIVRVKLLHREMTIFRAKNFKDIEGARICNMSHLRHDNPT